MEFTLLCIPVALISVLIGVYLVEGVAERYASRLAERQAWRVKTRELEPIAARFGPTKFSWHDEEFLIRDFFQDRRNGTFVDVGASHYQDRSNTYFLEVHLGWSGIAIDAIDHFRAGYEQHRPNTQFFTFFVSDVSDSTAHLYVTKNDLYSSMNREFAEQYADVSGSEDVRTITLNDLLRGQGIEHFDFLSMDIELAEPKALAGFDIERFKPSLVCIEGHAEVRQEILNYFQRHGYVLLGKYLRADPLNLWFAPVDGHLPQHEPVPRRER